MKSNNNSNRVLEFPKYQNRVRGATLSLFKELIILKHKKKVIESLDNPKVNESQA